MAYDFGDSGDLLVILGLYLSHTSQRFEINTRRNNLRTSTLDEHFRTRQDLI
jgi:hypothetical protein